MTSENSSQSSLRIDSKVVPGSSISPDRNQENLANDIFARTNIVPIVTPLDSNGAPLLSTNALVSFLNYLQELRVTHLFVLGETGEFRFLKNAERIAFAEALVPLAAAKGFKILLNVSAEELNLTRENIARFATMVGVDALILCPLWRGNLRIMEDSASARFLSEKPVVLYNNPGITDGNNIGDDQLKALRGRIAALKDSSGDINIVRRYRAASRQFGFTLYLGAEALLAQCLAEQASEERSEVQGIVGASGQIYDGCIRLLAEKDVSKREALQNELTNMMQSISENYRAIPAAVKRVLANFGIIPNANLVSGNSAVLRSTGTEAVEKFFPKKAASQ